MAVNKKGKIESAVSIFAMMSVIVAAGLLFTYGKIGSNLRQTYNIIAEVNDATGIRKGVPVRLGGVPVGAVATNPSLKEDYSGMRISLEIFQSVEIPKNSSFSIATVGLMGDSYIKISLPETLSGEFLQNDQVVVASTSSLMDLLQTDIDIDALAEEMITTLSEANDAIQEMKTIFTRIEKITNDENIARIEMTLENFSKSSDSINQASTSLSPTLESLSETMEEFQKLASKLDKTTVKIDPILSAAETSFTDISTTTKSAQELIDTIDTSTLSGLEALGALEGLDTTLAQMDVTLKNVNTLVQRVDNSDGLLSELIENKKFRNEFLNFVEKVEDNGFIFYPRTKKKSGIFAKPVH